MKRLLVLTALLLASIPSSVLSSAQVETGAWIVRDQLADPSNIAPLCEELKISGVETALVQIRGRADAYYDTDLAPRAEEILAPPPYDPYRAFLDACQAERQIAWLNVYYLWGDIEPPLSPEHPVNASPEWQLTDRDGRPVSEYTLLDRAMGWIEGVYADPASPGYRAHFVRLAREVVEKYPVNGLHLDFIRYPGPAYGQGGLLGAAWFNRYGFDARYLPATFGGLDIEGWLAGEMTPAISFITTAKLLWAGMRADSVTALLRDVRKSVKELNADIEISAAVVPDAPAAFLEKGQDWRGWMMEGLIDAIYPMSYFGSPERVGGQLKKIRSEARAIAPNVKLWAGLGAYIKEPSVIAEEAKIARDLGYDGICLFDCGSIREVEGGVGGYLREVRGEVNGALDEGRSLLIGSEGLDPLKLAVLKAFPGETLPADWESSVEARRREFDVVVAKIIPALLKGISGKEHRSMEWEELAGVFRYLHPLDLPERVDEQLELIDEAREKLLSGAAFDEVAAEYSQGGTKAFGGVLPRRYLRPGEEVDKLLAETPVGGVTPPVRVSNGYWLYKVLEKGGGKDISYDKIEWEERRIRFLGELSAAIQSGGAELSSKETENPNAKSN